MKKNPHLNCTNQKIETIFNSFKAECVPGETIFFRHETAVKSRVYNICYNQNADDMRDDYYGYTYDNSFARKRIVKRK